MESNHFHHKSVSKLNEVRIAVRGFTLVELMVVLAIIVIISTVVLTSQTSFNKTLILANTAYDIALTIRSTQSFGIGSRAILGTTNVGHGVHFQRGGSFILFADTSPSASCGRPDCSPGDYVYGAGDTFLQTYELNNGMTISNFCVDGLCTYSSLDVVFLRPNPDAFISVDGSTFTNYAKACLIVTSPQGGEKYVSVSKSGQIIANASQCP
ncbi:MAG: type II secretion system protein [bacterium]|nr:type II secretion system protein [bacterium]